MAKVTGRVVGIVGLLAATAAGCAHERRQTAAAAPASGPAQSAQRNAQNAAQQATATEQQLAQARKQLEAAHQEAIRAEQQRAQARQQAQQADQHAAAAAQHIGEQQANVARLEQAARERRDAATEAAMQAQVAAEEAQGLRSAAGRITQASPNRVVLEDQSGRTVSFDIDPRTRVLVGTEQRSVADLQRGAEARVAYDPRQGQPAAAVIHVNPARARAPLPPQQAPGQSAGSPQR